MATVLELVKQKNIEIGEPYDYLQLVGKMELEALLILIDKDIEDTRKKWIHPTINWTYQAMATAGNRYITNLEAQKVGIELLIKRRDAREIAVEENVIKQIPKEIIATPKKTIDYTRGLLIGGILFTGLMLLLIWRIG